MATKYYVEFFRYVENVDEPEVALAIPSAFADIPTAISQGALMFATIKSSMTRMGFNKRGSRPHRRAPLCGRFRRLKAPRPLSQTGRTPPPLSRHLIV